MPSFPLNQGAFTACAKLSQLEAFTQTAEVKVDPDKPLEGARLAVLQVALHCGKETPRTRVPQAMLQKYICTLFYLFCHHVNLIYMYEVELEIQNNYLRRVTDPLLHSRTCYITFCITEFLPLQ